jgi:DNA-binding winged helix-turn-helix (wHTH) protein/TolB-like protein
LAYLFESFELNEETFRLEQAGRRVPLEPKSLRVLLLLVKAKGKLVSKSTLLEEVWKGTFVDESTLTRAIALLRKQLGDDRRQPQFIETVPTIGYRFIAPVVEQSAADKTASTPAAGEEFEGISPAESPSKANPISRRAMAIAVGALFLLLIAGTFESLRGRRSQLPPIRSVAVLRLQNLSSEPNAEYFANGMTEELINELAAIPELRIVSDTSVNQSNGRSYSAADAGRTLGADAVLDGSVVRSGDKIHLDVHLVDVRSGQQLWAGQFEDSTKDVLSLQRHVAAEIAAHTQVLLTTSQKARIGSPQQLDPAAYDGYLQGRYLLSKRDAEGAVTLFRRAVVLDPSYSRAWAGLAAGLADSAMGATAPLNGPVREAKAAAKHALELDPESGEAWSVLGQLAFSWEWDWKTAEFDLQRAIALSPSDSTTELRYATYLSIVGRHDEAVSHMRRALGLEPMSFFNVRHMGSVLYWAGQYDESLEYLRRAQEMEPNLIGFTTFWKSFNYEMKGMREEAVMVDFENVTASNSGGWHNRLDSAYRSGGRKSYWETKIRMLQSNPQPGPCMEYEIATIHARIGENDEALKDLDRALKEHCFFMSQFNTEPLFEGLHGDPRFKDLQKKMNLTE